MDNIIQSIKKLTVVSIVTGGILIVGLLYYLILEYIPIKTLDVKNQPVAVLEDTVYAGGIVNVLLDYDKHINKEAMVTVQYCNDLIWTAVPFISNLPSGKHLKIYMIKVPDHLPSGSYYAIILISYKINSLRSITKTIKTQRFFIK